MKLAPISFISFMSRRCISSVRATPIGFWSWWRQIPRSFIGLSVKVEAFVGFEMEPAETGMVVALVYDGLCFAVEQGGFYSVEVGRFRSP